MLNRLIELHKVFGQSVWIDHLSRSWLEQGALKEWIQRGCRGITSNPTIFEKSLTADDSYDADLMELHSSGMSVEDIYWELVIKDVSAAAAQLRPIYEESLGYDGFVSVEIAPALANDTEATITEAITLRERFEAENILIKVPATRPGVAAIGPLIAQGVNLNLTLIFSLQRYREVAEAYITAVEALDSHQIRKVNGVASFFVSRVDTEVDARLAKLAQDPNRGRLPHPGQAAVAQAKLAYEIFLDLFTGPRWQQLIVKGAKVQRPLWASTSTKNPVYGDTMYVDSLIGLNTVNTLPENTANAFDHHGNLESTVNFGLDEARQLWLELAECGVDMADVSLLLEQQGLRAFAELFDKALESLEAKAELLKILA